MSDRQLFTTPGPEPQCLGRIWLAFALMPLVSGLAGLLLSGGVAPVAFLASACAIFVTFAGGLPAFLTLKRRGPISLSQTMWVGAALGNLPSAVYAVMLALYSLVHLAAGTLFARLLPLPQLVASAVMLILFGSAVGAASAAVFWFVALKGTDLSD